MKKLLTLVLVIAMVLSFASVASAEEQKTLKVLWWGSQTRHDTTTKMLEVYGQLHPELNIEIDYASWGDYWTKLATQVSGGTVPDLIQMDYAYLTQYAKNGVIANLDEYIASGALNVDNVSASIIASGKYMDSVYAIPTGTNALTLMYDPAKVGDYEVPTFMTYSEYIDLCKDLNAEFGYTENYISSYGTNQLNFYLRNLGYEFYAADQKSLGWDDPQILADLLELVDSAIKEGWGLNPAKAVAADTFSSITAGDTWAVLHWTNELNATETGNGANLEMIALPAADDAVRAATFFKPSMLWSVNANSEVLDEAVEFINWFVNDLTPYEICGTDRGFPISTVVLENIAPTFNEQNQKIAAMIGELSKEGNTSPIMPADPTAASEIGALFGDMIERVQYGLVEDFYAEAEAWMAAANELLAAE